jgi:hypothetical protein
MENPCEYYEKAIQNLLASNFANIVIAGARNTCSKSPSTPPDQVWCRHAIMALFIKLSLDDKVVGCALKFIKSVEFSNGEIIDFSISNSNDTYINELLDSLKDTFKSLSNNSQIIDIEVLENKLRATIANYYRSSNHKRKFAPDENLKDELKKSLPNSLELKAKPNSNDNNSSLNDYDSLFNF